MNTFKSKKDIFIQFEKLQARLGRTIGLSRSNGRYDYGWMRDVWEGYLLCAIENDVIEDTAENRDLSVPVDAPPS